MRIMTRNEKNIFKNKLARSVGYPVDPHAQRSLPIAILLSNVQIL